MTLPTDVGSVLIDGRKHWFVAHLVVRRSWWRGRVVAVMNAQWIARWDVAPKSHPNDGLLDVFDGDLSLDDRLKLRSRLATGTHVPHPGITQSRVAALQLELDRPTPVWLDGERVGSGRNLVIRTEADALALAVCHAWRGPAQQRLRAAALAGGIGAPIRQTTLPRWTGVAAR
jgi:diacylglycerol kinase family enzyme